MKKIKLRLLIPAGFIAASLLVSVNGFSQNKKLSDGSIVYNDGTKKLSNGTVVYKGENLGKSTTTVKLPDGSVIFPDGSRRYPNHKRINRRTNGKLMPPGQAKKIYGGSAKDYAPGQQKKWKNKDNGWREDGDKGSHQNNGKGKGHK